MSPSIEKRQATFEIMYIRVSLWRNHRIVIFEEKKFAWQNKNDDFEM